MNGIEKDVDNLGRIVLPIKYRKKLGIESNSKVLVTLEDDGIIISPTIKHCALCGKNIEKENKFKLCDECILKIRTDA